MHQPALEELRRGPGGVAARRHGAARARGHLHRRRDRRRRGAGDGHRDHRRRRDPRAVRAVGRGLRRCQQLRARPPRRLRHRPRLLLRVAALRRRAPRTAGVRPHQRAGLRSGPADDAGGQRTGPPALGVHAAARREHRRAEQGRDRVAAAGAVRGHPRQRHPAAQHHVHLPGQVGRPVASGPRPAGRRRGPPHAALRRAGHVLRHPRRRQPGVEARPDAARRRRRVPCGHLPRGAPDAGHGGDPRLGPAGPRDLRDGPGGRSRAGRDRTGEPPRPPADAAGTGEAALGRPAAPATRPRVRSCPRARYAAMATVDCSTTWWAAVSSC